MPHSSVETIYHTILILFNKEKGSVSQRLIGFGAKFENSSLEPKETVL